VYYQLLISLVFVEFCNLNKIQGDKNMWKTFPVVTTITRAEAVLHEYYEIFGLLSLLDRATAFAILIAFSGSAREMYDKQYKLYTDHFCGNTQVLFHHSERARIVNQKLYLLEEEYIPLLKKEKYNRVFWKEATRCMAYVFAEMEAMKKLLP
jgi:hypothetical protein